MHRISTIHQIEHEKELWNKFRGGNYQSFKEIYQNHVTSLIHYGLKFTKDRDLVKDSVHELFVDIYNNRKTLGLVKKIRPYLIRSLKNKLIRTIQAKRKTIFLHGTELPFLLEFSLEKLIEDKELDNVRNDLVKEVLCHLSSRQKEAIYLRFTEGLNYEQISQVMGINYQSARNLVHRSIIRLRQILIGYKINQLY